MYTSEMKHKPRAPKNKEGPSISPPPEPGFVNDEEGDTTSNATCPSRTRAGDRYASRMRMIEVRASKGAR